MPAFVRYEILERIGVGGMAEVFLAIGFRQDGSEERVVVKQVLAHLCEDKTFQRMLFDEAMIAGSLVHPNIVRALDFGRMDGRHFIALEHVSGADLERIFRSARKRGTPIGIDEALFVVSELLKGLHFAHTSVDPAGKPREIIHRDVSLANVLISRAGEVKIHDFGLARAAVSSGETRAGVVKGSLRYMSPEQVGAQPLDARTDVYSAGIVLHTLLSGRHPLEDVELAALPTRILEGSIPPPSTFALGVPKVLDRIVARALDPMPWLRFSSAAEFQNALAEFSRIRGKALSVGSLGALVTRLLAPDPDDAHEPVSAEKELPSIVEAIGMDPSGVTQPSDHSDFRTIAGPAPSTSTELGPRAASDDDDDTELGTAAGGGATVAHRPPRRLLGGTGAINAIAITPDGNLVLSAGHDQAIRIWDVANLRVVRTLKGHTAAIISLAVSSDGRFVLSGGRDKTMRYWNLETGEMLGVFEGHDGWVLSVGFATGGRGVSSSADRSVRVWDLDGRRQKSVIAAHTDLVPSISVGAGGRQVLSASYDQTIKLWDIDAGKCLRLLETTDGVRAVAFSPDGLFGLSGGADGLLRMWDLRREEQIRGFAGHRGPIVSVNFSRDGKRAVTGSYDGTARVWDLSRERGIPHSLSPGSPALSVGFSSDDTVVIGCADGSVTVHPLR